ncbi:MAG TPA: NapC/NirT family cytochrome c, partial [Burkholderiales bacterium]|nr:NapC/NirT family cytochrome c [Burkholderiales bacterium]
MFKTWWTNLQSRCKTCSRVTLGAGLILVTLLVGAVMLTAGAAGLAWTNTEQFCIGCHEMKDNVYAEFKGTIHDVNRSGVRAICSNCHVPHEPWP